MKFKIWWRGTLLKPAFNLLRSLIYRFCRQKHKSNKGLVTLFNQLVKTTVKCLSSKGKSYCIIISLALCCRQGESHKLLCRRETILFPHSDFLDTFPCQRRNSTCVKLKTRSSMHLNYYFYIHICPSTYIDTFIFLSVTRQKKIVNQIIHTKKFYNMDCTCVEWFCVTAVDSRSNHLNLGLSWQKVDIFAGRKKNKMPLVRFEPAIP